MLTTNRIQKFSPIGERLNSFGEKGTEPGQFDVANAVATDHKNRIYAVDFYNNRVQIFDDKGTFLYQFGTVGKGEGQFKHPTDVAISKEAEVYVVDFGNNRIQKFRILEK